MQFEYSKTSLKRIGEKLRHSLPLTEEEESIFAKYRVGHRNIIETFRQKHKQAIASGNWPDNPIVFASRLKKRSTISTKLASRQCKMDLTRMNDIAGCRLIFPSVRTLNAYREFFLVQGGKFGHYALRTTKDQYDYIARPRDTGYRGIHDVYEEVGPDVMKAKIEVQYRTVVQHSWATALEIWDYSHEKGAKFGLDAEEVQYLFKYISELFWRYIDADPSDKRIAISSRVLYKSIVELDKRVGLINFFASNKRISVPSKFIRAAKDKDGILLRRVVFDGVSKESGSVKVVPKMWDDLTEELFDDEKQDMRDSVLISMDGEFVKIAYNNYFDDARKFKQNLIMSLEHAYDDINTFKRHFVPDVEPLVEVLRKER